MIVTTGGVKPVCAGFLRCECKIRARCFLRHLNINRPADCQRDSIVKVCRSRTGSLPPLLLPPLRQSHPLFLLPHLLLRQNPEKTQAPHYPHPSPSPFPPALPAVPLPESLFCFLLSGHIFLTRFRLTGFCCSPRRNLRILSWLLLSLLQKILRQGTHSPQTPPAPCPRLPPLFLFSFLLGVILCNLHSIFLSGMPPPALSSQRLLPSLLCILSGIRLYAVGMQRRIVITVDNNNAVICLFFMPSPSLSDARGFCNYIIQHFNDNPAVYLSLRTFRARLYWAKKWSGCKRGQEFNGVTNPRTPMRVFLNFLRRMI